MLYLVQHHQDKDRLHHKDSPLNSGHILDGSEESSRQILVLVMMMAVVPESQHNLRDDQPEMHESQHVHSQCGLGDLLDRPDRLIFLRWRKIKLYSPPHVWAVHMRNLGGSPAVVSCHRAGASVSLYSGDSQRSQSIAFVCLQQHLNQWNRMENLSTFIVT